MRGHKVRVRHDVTSPCSVHLAKRFAPSVRETPSVFVTLAMSMTSRAPEITLDRRARL